METFGGNFKQRQSFLLYTHNFFGVFSKSYTDFVILNYKELANFEITSGYPLPNTVETPNKGHFGTNYKFKWFVHCIETVLCYEIAIDRRG